MSASFSKIDTYGKCPKLYFYKYIKNLQPKRQNSNLYKGIRAHDMLKDWFLTKRDGDVAYPEEFVDEWILTYFNEFDATQMFEDELFDVKQEVEAIGEIVKNFLLRDEFKGWTILHVEEEFVLDIDGEVVTFTPDLVARDPEGFIWIIDHKTTASFIEENALVIRPQALLYYIGISAIYDNVAGFIFNYMRKKVPTVPRLNKTRTKGIYRVHDLNRIDTTYEMLFEFVQANDLMDDEDHRARLAELRDKDTFYFKHKEYITDDMVKEARGDIASRLYLMSHAVYPRTIQPLNGCNSCGFQALCVTELTGGNTDMVLDWYEPREDKNPNREEDNDE